MGKRAHARQQHQTQALEAKCQPYISVNQFKVLDSFPPKGRLGLPHRYVRVHYLAPDTRMPEGKL